MRVLKEQNASLLVTNLGLSGKHYIVFSVLVFSDIFEPDRLFLERDLWKAAQKALPPKTPLDPGMPKTVGEVLVSGSCYAAQGEMIKAQRCSVRVGDIHKELMVFGDRYWLPAGYGPKVTDPVPFTAMPLDSSRSFGGPEITTNPDGKGSAPVSHEGMNLLPLPNIEYPNRLVASPHDTPNPAGFWPWSIMHPKRQELTGTYDEQWKQTHWPDYPEDFNPLFFNSAPPDQRLPNIEGKNWFSAGELVDFVGLRPDVRQISTRLPHIRVRLFAALRQNGEMPTSEAPSHPAAFVETKPHIDTVHILPESGIITIYRAVIETQRLDQDELADVFLAVEPLESPQKTIEDYFAERAKRLDRAVPMVDQSKLDAAAQKKAQAMEEVQAVPDRIAAAMDRAMGRAPKPVQTPQSIVAEGGKRLANAGSKLTAASALVASFGERFGSQAAMAAPHIEKAQQLLAVAQEHMGRATAATIKATEKAKALHTEAAQVAQKSLDDAAKKSPSIAAKLPQAPKLFQEPPFQRIMIFLTECRKRLLEDETSMNTFFQRGFLRHTIADTFVGLNDEPFVMNPKDWGLADGPAVDVPAGFVWPVFDGAQPIRIVMLEHGPDVIENAVDWTGFEKPAYVDRFAPEKPLVITRHPLDALLARQVAGRVFTIATPIQDGDAFPADVAKAMKTNPVLVLQSNEPTDEEKAFFTSLASSAPSAIACPMPQGTRLYESKQAGTNLLSWLVAALPPEEQEKQAEAVAAATSLPKANTIAAAVKADTDAIAQKAKAKAGALKAEAQSIAAKTSAQIRRPLPVPETRAPLSPTAVVSRLEEGLPWKSAEEPLPKSVGEAVQAKHTATVAALREKLDAVTATGAARLRQGLAKADAAKAMADDPIPAWAKDMMRKAGVPAGGKIPGLAVKLTPQDVLQAHAQGQSFAESDLSELDFSGMDLTGIDLRKANIQKCLFTKTILDKAQLQGALAREADFTEASLIEADLNKTMCMKSQLKKANLTQTNLAATNFAQAKCSEACFNDAHMQATLFQETELDKATFHNADLKQATLNKASLKQASFIGASLFRCTFLDAVLDEADFTGADFQKTLFFRCQAPHACFQSITGEGLRIMKMSDFSNSVFTNARLVKASFMESNFTQAEFTRATLERCFFDRSQLSSSHFYATNAAHSRFLKSNLERADMRGINLIYGKLRGSHLPGADLRGANLFGVDFFKVTVGETRFEQANLGMTLLENRTGFIR